MGQDEHALFNLTDKQLSILQKSNEPVQFNTKHKRHDTHGAQ